MKKEEIELMRHIMGSIDLSDIETLKEEVLSSENYKNRAVDAEVFYKLHFEKLIKLFIQKQMEFMMENDIDISFARGTINGFSLIKDWFEDQVKLSLSRFEEEEKEETGEIKPV